jgi:hypothetical protein
LTSSSEELNITNIDNRCYSQNDIPEVHIYDMFV